MPHLTRRLLAGAAALMVTAAACSGASLSPNDGDRPGTTRDQVVSSVTTAGDRVLVEAAADSYPQPGDIPWGYSSLRLNEWLAFCAEALGFSVTLMNEPGQPPTLFADVTGEQRLRLTQVYELCTAEAQERGWVEPALTSEVQLRAEYDRLVAVNGCLTELGYGTDPMSWDTYQETRDWNVYANTPRGSILVVAPSAGTDLPEEVRLQLSIQEACPLWEPAE